MTYFESMISTMENVISVHIATPGSNENTFFLLSYGAVFLNVDDQ